MLYSPVSRRTLLKTTGLAIASGSVISVQACAESSPDQQKLALYLVIQNDALTFILPRSEMGQDIATSFAILIAEELGTSPSAIRVNFAEASEQIPDQMTVGSASVRTWWMHMRQVGANTRAWLLKVAATKSGRAVEDFEIEFDSVRSLDHAVAYRFSDLATEWTIPAQVSNAPLKSMQDFEHIGRHHISPDNHAKSTGQFTYLDDWATQQNIPKAMSVNYKAGWPRPSEKTLALLKQRFGLMAAFVRDAQIGAYAFRVFLVHHSTWPLLKAKTELENNQLKSLSHSDFGAPNNIFDTDMSAPLHTSSVSPSSLSLMFETPAIAHAPMEPPNGAMTILEDYIEVWAPTQAPDHARAAVAKRLNYPSEQITLHTLAMGGAFGRKRYSDYLEELAIATRYLADAQLSQSLALIWTREDELAREHYRPATRQVVSWSVSQANQIVLEVQEGFAGAHEAAPVQIQTELPLGLAVTATKQVRDHAFVAGIWRSVYHGYHAFALCSSIDEMCLQTGQNTLAYYRSHPRVDSIKTRLKNLLKGRKSIPERSQDVIDTVQRMADWPSFGPHPRGFGFASYSVFGSHIAVIAKIAIKEDQLHVQHVWAAVDCGMSIHPDKLKAQIEGGILYGLSACLYGEIPLNKDLLAMNFDNQPVLRMTESPSVDVHVIASQESPTGAGELGVPPIAPAVCNAIRTLTPYRFTKLPLLKAGKLKYDNALKVSQA